MLLRRRVGQRQHRVVILHSRDLACVFHAIRQLHGLSPNLIRINCGILSLGRRESAVLTGKCR
jgi:hypothetical protein